MNKVTYDIVFSEKAKRIRKVKTLLMFAKAKREYYKIDRLKYLLRQLCNGTDTHNQIKRSTA